MQRKNIPSYILAKGISREGFKQLLDDIRNAAIEEGVKDFSNYSDMLEAVKSKGETEEAKQWISDFEMQLNSSINIINENMVKIEDLFNRIFADWEEYKKEHDIVEEINEETVQEEVVNTTEETPEVKEEVSEEVKVELEPVVVNEEVTETKQEENVDTTVELTPVVEEKEVEEAPKTEEAVEVPVVEETTEDTKKAKKSKKDKSEVTEGDNNG